MTHEFLQPLPCFIQDFVLEQTGGPGTFNFVTAVVWEDGHALDIAETIVVETHKMMGFAPKEMFGRLGIDTDLATYVAVRTSPSAGANSATTCGSGNSNADAVPPFATISVQLLPRLY